MNKFIFPILLIGFLVFGFMLRLYRINNPIADWHEWRQADTSSVSRNFVASGFDLLHPKFDDLSNVPSGKDNPMGYRFVEFPIYNVFQAGLYKIFGILTLEEWGRMVSIIASLFSAVFIYLFVKKNHSELAGIIAASFFLFLPFNIYYSRTILPDPSMVTTILAGIYFFDLLVSTENKKKKIIFFALSAIFTLTSFLLKPYAIIFTLPFLAILFNKYKLSFIKIWYFWLFLIITVLPLVFWRIWITHYPEGIPASDWLLNGGNIRL